MGQSTAGKWGEGVKIVSKESAHLKNVDVLPKLKKSKILR
jgi:hypothetical protein